MSTLRRIRPDMVSESPVKRQRTNAGAAKATQDSYHSDDDDADELFDGYETVATLPIDRPAVSQFSATQTHVTQPTQILDRPKTLSEKAPGHDSVVQVIASSPLRPSGVASVDSSRSKSLAGGVLARAMAPPGTAFRLPPGVKAAPPSVPIIDLSDDDGPTYQGDSSDEAASEARRVDIKPSTFAKSGDAVGRAGRGEISPGAGVARFREITSNAFYKPLDPSKPRGAALSGSVFDSRNRDEQMTSSTFAAVPRPSTKQQRPERAKQVEDISLDTIQDFHMRDKVVRMRRILPSTSILACQTALVEKRGNFDDAMDWLTLQEERGAAVDLTISDEDLAADPLSQLPKPTAKRQVKAPNRTIQDKYSSTQTLSRPQLSAHVAGAATALTPPKPRKRLVKGRKYASSPAEAPKPPPKRSASPFSSDGSDSGLASPSGDDVELDGKVLGFFNSCSVKDLADIASVSVDIAQAIVAQKPFASLDEIRMISTDVPSTTTKRKTTKKAVGEKVVQTCLDTWTGYEAVDELVAKCEALGTPVAKEMKKWGVDVYGAAQAGEMEIVSLDDTHRAARDSGIGTPMSSPQTPKEEEGEGEGEIHGAVGSRAQRSKKSGFIAQPSNMGSEVVLKDYQLVGINWLTLLFDQGLSCILADEMGLGKTCQVIAFLAHLLDRGEKGPHLVVVPGSTLENWLREFKRFCPALVVEPYYGPEKERGEMRDQITGTIARINVIVTTYDLATKPVDNKFLRRLRPTVCVYDEGHALKNSNSNRYEALMRIPATFRLLLTGTPLQNNLRELAALLGFILPSVFNERRGDLELIFKHRAKTADSNHDALLSAQRIARAKSMMTPFVLRRKKHQVLKHLPPKTTRVEYCEMTAVQREVYEEEVRLTREAMECKAAGKKSDRDGYNVMMQLRKAAIHPMLFRRLFDDAKIRAMSHACLKEAELSDRDAEFVYEDMSYYSDFQLHTFCEEHPATMSPYNIQHDEWMDSGKVAKLAELLLTFRANGDRALVFSQFTMVLNILEAVMETLQMQFFRIDGQTRIDERQDMIDQFYEETDVTVFLLSTKAGGQGINLACANKVIIFDQSFNPQEDMQAENRAHRVGQQRPVEVIRLVSNGTIEEQIHALGETKLALDERVSGDVGGDTDAKVEEQGMDMVKSMWLKTSQADGEVETAEVSVKP